MMSFNIRKAKVSDVNDIYLLIKDYYDNTPNNSDIPFNITSKKLIEDAFSNKPKVFILIAEFKGNILGYCAYFYAYDVFQGSSIIIEEVFVSKDYRNLGIALFIFSKLVEVGVENKTEIIRWVIDIRIKTFVLLLKNMNVNIDYNSLLLNIYKEDFIKHIKIVSNSSFTTRFATVLDLPSIFDLVKESSKELKEELTVDLYKLIADGFALNPKFSILITLDKNDEIIGYLFFYEAYSTFNGKSLIINKTYINKVYRLEEVKNMLYHNLFNYAAINGYERIETIISQEDYDKLNYLEKNNIKPLKHNRIASFKKVDYMQLINIKK